MTGYLYQQALEASTEYFQGDEFAAKVFVDKYALQNKEGEFLELTPSDMHRRLAKEFARIEAKYPNPMSEEEIFGLLDRYRFIVPQGSPMFGIGNEHYVQSLGNCFVVESPYDSYGGILKTDQEMAQLMKRRAGVGTDIANIRPKGMPTKNAAKTTDGIGIFIHRYSNTCREVAQCLGADTLVLTINGLKYIADIKIGDEVWTNQKWIPVEKILRNKKQVVKVITKHGREIFCSSDHVFHTIGGEKAIKNLIINSPITQIVGEGWQGKSIVLNKIEYEKRGSNKSNRLNKNIIIPELLDDSLAYLLGLMYGDGCIENNYKNIDTGICVALSDDWPEITNKFSNLTKKVFGINPSIINKDGEKCSRGRIYSREVIEHLRFNNLLKQKSDSIKFPKQLLSAHKSVVFSFIAGFFDSDGCVQKSKKQYKISSIQKQFILNIQNILSSFGIVSKIHKEIRCNTISQENWKDLYTLCVNGKKNQDIFKANMSESIKISTSHSFNKKRDCTKTIYKISDFDSVSSRHSYVIDNNQYISYTTSDRLKEELNNDKNIFLLQDHIEYISDESNESFDVYDLVLAKEHLFFANGLYAHNSGRRGALMISNHINHPEIETFIHIKDDPKNVTGANLSIRITDAFMTQVKSDGEFTLQWPVTSKDPVVTKTVKAKNIWDQIIDCAWSRAEPGVLFWDRIIDNSPADIYAKKYPNFRTQSTNPCFSGDTLIAVADGRNAVTIKQLAEEGKDVPVYSVDKNGMVSIKLARHPRITGYEQKLVRILLDDGSYFDVTPNHKCLLLNGEMLLAKDLKYGDSLPRFTKKLEPVKQGSKDYYRIYCNTRDSSKNKIFEHRLIAKFYDPETWDQVYNSSKENGFVKSGGLVIHHKDYNQLNNSPNNLQIMTFQDHSKLHGEIDQSGENNGRYSGFTSEEIRQKALELTISLGRRFSKDEWQIYAKELKLPRDFSKFRVNELGTLLELSKWCAAECNLEYIDCDPRLVRTYQDMLLQGYDTIIINNKVMVKKQCELCFKDFEVEYLRREGAYCSQRCGSAAWHNNQVSNQKVQQAYIYSTLAFQLGRKPKLKEWEQACKNKNISYRIGKSLKFGYHNFKEVTAAGNNYNHKVVSVTELDETHIVYNLTVDENHTVAIITDEKIKGNDKSYSGIFAFQCGELPLGLDSCRLLVVNLLSFVTNPFTKKAKFDYELYASVCQKAQRLMDDLVDLEIEKINTLIKKIQSDPEPEVIKVVELNMWNQFLQSCTQGRRTGTGITALGDCLAALGIKYGSTSSIEVTGEIYKHLMINAYKSSFIMAGERGAFPIFDPTMEEGHPFISLVLSQEPELKRLYNKHGRRNVALLTTAPTGSVSTQTQTTSGIEPVYMLSYVRRKKHNPSDKNARADFVDAMGDSWQEFTVYHHGVKRWMDITGETDITKSPYYGATSNDIDWVASVDLQAIAQRYIDHSISKTCNLPENVSKEVVSQVYMRAWEKGCKGFTVYRDKCRDGVLISASQSKKSKDGRPGEITISEAPKRPIELLCDIKKAKIQGEQWTIFVGLLNGKPYEVFGGLSKYVDIPNKFKLGKIVKNGKIQDITTYNLILGEGDDQMLIKDIANVFDNANFGAFTRTISLALRHGTPMQYVVEQLQKDKHSDITSFSKVIARVLKNYILDGTKSTAERKCPSCGNSQLVYEQGCMGCVGGTMPDGTPCTWSKC